MNFFKIVVSINSNSLLLIINYGIYHIYVPCLRVTIVVDINKRFTRTKFTSLDIDYFKVAVTFWYTYGME